VLRARSSSWMKERKVNWKPNWTTSTDLLLAQNWQAARGNNNSLLPSPAHWKKHNKDKQKAQLTQVKQPDRKVKAISRSRSTLCIGSGLGSNRMCTFASIKIKCSRWFATLSFYNRQRGIGEPYSSKWDFRFNQTGYLAHLDLLILDVLE
jgi:hypothetical protein